MSLKKIQRGAVISPPFSPNLIGYSSIKYSAFMIRIPALASTFHYSRKEYIFDSSYISYSDNILDIRIVRDIRIARLYSNSSAIVSSETNIRLLFFLEIDNFFQQTTLK